VFILAVQKFHMINNKDKKKLKAIANTSTHKYQIGKDKTDDNVILTLVNALKAHELIKVYFNKSVASSIDELTKVIINKTNSELVGQIGHMIIIYKENKEKKNRIIL